MVAGAPGAGLALPGHAVDAAWLARHLEHPALRVVESSVALDSASGVAVTERPAFDARHVPGASFVDLIEELSDPEADARMAQVGRMFMLPTPATFATVMGRCGLGPDDTVVVMTRSAPMWATRLWWMLRYFGHERVAVLDGGWRAWLAGGHPVSSSPDGPVPTRFVPDVRSHLLASRADVAASLDDAHTVLINALTPELFRGEDTGRRRRPGRIPGSRNVPYTAVHDAEGRLRPAADLAPLFAEVGALDAGRVVTYCGGGIAATVDAFALAMLGVEAAVYDGSLNEWGSDPDAPLEVG